MLHIHSSWLGRFSSSTWRHCEVCHSCQSLTWMGMFPWVTMISSCENIDMSCFDPKSVLTWVLNTDPIQYWNLTNKWIKYLNVLQFSYFFVSYINSCFICLIFYSRCQTSNTSTSWAAPKAGWARRERWSPASPSPTLWKSPRSLSTCGSSCCSTPSSVAASAQLLHKVSIYSTISPGKHLLNRRPR